MVVAEGHFCISCPAVPVFKINSSQILQKKTFCVITTTIDITPTYLSIWSSRFCLHFLQSERGIDGEPAKESAEGIEPAGTATITQGGWGWTLYTAGHGASGLRHRASWPGSEAQLNPKLWFLAHNKAGNTFIVFNVWNFIKIGWGWKKSAWMVKIRTRQTVPGCNKIDERETLGDELGFGRPPAQLEPCSDWHPCKS